MSISVPGISNTSSWSGCISRWSSLTNIRATTAMLAIAVAFTTGLVRAQSVPVPSSAFSVESWMSAGSLSVESPTSALVGQSTSGFNWDVSVFADSGGSSPAVYNAIQDALANGGTLDYTIRFDPSLIVTPGAQPGFIGVNTFFQSDSPESNFIQNYNIPILGSADFPLSGERTFNVSLPIESWTGASVPANNTGDAWFNPDGNWFKVGFGLNFDNASSVGFYLEDVSVNAVPEPSSLGAAGLAAAALGGLACRRLRRRSGPPATGADGNA